MGQEQEHRKEQRGKAGVGGTGPGTEKGGGWRERGGQRGPEMKRRPLVEDVLEYQELYERGGDD